MNEVSLREAVRGRGSQAIADQLRDEIIALTLKPGTVLSRADLQARFGVSSTPVRDALLRLQEEGLVDVFPQHATMVSPIDVTRARQAQFLRRSIELELVRALAITRDDEAIARLRSYLHQQKALATVGEYEAFTRADQDFHKVLYEVGDVIDLWHLVRRRGGHIDRLRRLNLPVGDKIREVLRDHEEIVASIEAGEVDRAQSALRDHLSRSLDFVSVLRERFPEYFRQRGDRDEV